jgi:CRP-like cAMP-binding protein
MALLDHQPRTATVTAREPSEVLVLTTRAFTGVVDTMPSVDRKMLAVLAGRLRDLEDRFLPAERNLSAETEGQLARK